MAREAATWVNASVEVTTEAGDGLSAFVRNSPFLMAQLDGEGRLLAMSGGWLLQGVEPAAAVACGRSALISEPRKLLSECLEGGQVRATVKRQFGGGEHAFDVNLCRTKIENDAPTILVCATDVTDLLVELEEGERRRDLALRIAGIFWRDLNYKTGDLKITGANARMYEIFRQDLRNMPHVAAEHQAAVQREIVTSIAERRPFHLHYRLNVDEGQETYIETIGEYIFDSAGKPERLFSVIRDVTEERKAQRRIAELALTDGLTGLGNRTLFQQEFSAAVSRYTTLSEGLGLVMFDVDHFKAVNDGMGHDAGDALLRSLGISIRQAFDATGIPVRLGGDEFAVIMHGANDETDLSRPIEALRRLLDEPVLHDGHRISIEVSIGAALMRDMTNGEPADLLKKADVALYQSKAGGRNRTVIYKPVI